MRKVHQNFGQRWAGADFEDPSRYDNDADIFSNLYHPQQKSEFSKRHASILSLRGLRINLLIRKGFMNELRAYSILDTDTSYI